MNKTFKFIYDSGYEDGMDLYPLSSVIKAAHTFDDGTRWQPILHQFCKFLESTGYVGVLEKIVIVDPYAISYDNHLFHTVRAIPKDEYGDEFGEDDEEEEDAEEEDEEKDFQDVKKEIA
jgi:hypothetical protein